MRPRRIAPCERLLQLGLRQPEPDGVGGEVPVGARCLPRAEGFHLRQLVAVLLQLDARSHEGVGAFALALDLRFADQHAQARGLIHRHGVGAGGEVGAVDRDVAARPHAIVALEVHAVAHDDVRLAGIGLAAVLDGRPLRGEHLQGIADARGGAEVVQVGSAQGGAVPAVLGDHIIVCFEAFFTQIVVRQIGVEREGRIADLDASNHVEAPLAGIPRHTVGGEGRVRAVAVCQYAAAREVVGVPRRPDRLAAIVAHRVDRDLAGTPLRPRGVGLRRLLGERHEHHDH